MTREQALGYLRGQINHWRNSGHAAQVADALSWIQALEYACHAIGSGSQPAVDEPEKDQGAALLPADPSATVNTETLPTEQIRLLAYAVVNCHVLARRALHRSTSAYDREKWEHVVRLCENAGARSRGVLRASLPTELTDGSGNPATKEHADATRRSEAP